jgi:hypothetical protein
MPEIVQTLSTFGRIGLVFAGLVAAALVASACQTNKRLVETPAVVTGEEPTSIPKELETATFAMG